MSSLAFKDLEGAIELPIGPEEESAIPRDLFLIVSCKMNVQQSENESTRWNVTLQGRTEAQPCFRDVSDNHVNIPTGGL